MLVSYSTLRLPFAPLLLLLLSTSSLAADVEGSWAGTFISPGSLAAMRLKITSQKDRADSKLIVNVYGQESVSPILNFVIQGADVSFQAEVFKEQIKFFGKFQNNTLSGSIELVATDRPISGNWNLRRVDDSFLSKSAQLAPIVPRGKVELPKPTGPFPIGRRTFHWTDESRAEAITPDEADRRKLFVQLWYPAGSSNRGAAAVYYPDVEELQAKNPNLNVLRAIRTHAKADVPLAKSKAPLPLIIFSPGLGNSISSYATIIENLASNGYVVAAINHAYDAEDFKFSDGEIIRYETSLWDKPVSDSWTADARKQFFDERRLGWAQDTLFVINQLARLNRDGFFQGKLDIANSGALGHSFGGQSVTIACAEDVRLKACANLDGLAQGNAFLPNAKGENLRQPFLFFTKNSVATDYELTIMGLNRSEYDARDRRRMLELWKPSLKDRLAVLKQGTYFAVVRGGTHRSFSDIPLLEANPTNETLAERQFRAKVINEYILAFFNKFLRKGNSYLLDGQNQTRPQVVVEILRK